jgi:hypothetical protein
MIAYFIAVLLAKIHDRRTPKQQTPRAWQGVCDHRSIGESQCCGFSHNQPHLEASSRSATDAGDTAHDDVS